LGDFGVLCNMESIIFLLKIRRHRRLQLEFNDFLSILILYLSAGFELTYAWRETLNLMQERISSELKSLLLVAQNESLNERLLKISEIYPIIETRVWFSVLSELYLTGGPLLEAIKAFSKSVRNSLKNDIEYHLRTIFTKTNILMLLFFLPPTLILIFIPILKSLFIEF